MWKAIREFFWPVLDHHAPGSLNSKPPIKNQIAEVRDSAIDSMLAEVVRAYESERQRRLNVETKSGQMATFNTLIVTVAIGVASIFYSDKPEARNIGVIGMPLMMLMLMYFAKSTWHSIKALERGAYHVITVEDPIKPAAQDATDFKRQMIVEYITCAKSNYKTINGKVDHMVMSQEFFKRGIVALTLEGFWIGAYFMFPYVSGFYQSMLTNLCRAF